jgi:hypothetical protein
MLGTVKGASAGKAGQWLIDPNDVTISTATTANMSGNPFTPNGTSSGNVNNGSIETALNSGTDVTVTTAGSGSASGSITWSSGNISKTAGGNATLTLTANSTISLSGINITSTSNRLNLNLSAAQNGIGGLVVFNNTTLATNGGNITGYGIANDSNIFTLTGNNTWSLGTGSGNLTGSYVSDFGSTGSGLSVVGTWNITTSGSVLVNVSRNYGSGIGLNGSIIVNGGTFNIISKVLAGALNAWIDGTSNITANGSYITIATYNYGNQTVTTYYLNGTLNLNSNNNGPIALSTNNYNSGVTSNFNGARLNITASNNSSVSINPTTTWGSTPLIYDGAYGHSLFNVNLTNNSKFNINF